VATLTAVAAATAVALTGCSAPPVAPFHARAGSVASHQHAAAAVLTTDPMDTFAGSLDRTLPPDLSPPVFGRPGCPDAQQVGASVAREEAASGSPGWRSASPTGPRNVAFYLDRTSVSCGDTVSVHLGGRGGPVRVEVWRMGWYHGAGGRLVERTPTIEAVPGTTTDPVQATRSPQLDWPTALQLQVTPAWVPGAYLLVLRPQHGAATWAPLVVRDDTGRAPLLVVLDDLTWAAYDTYGGRSLYLGDGRGASASANRAYAVPLTRPMDGRDAREVQLMDLPVVRYVEQLGLRVDYTTDTAVDATPSTLLQHSGVVFGGHSEYWTRRMYDAVETARNRGVNLAFLGANDAYWQARLGGPGDPAATGPAVAADSTDASRTSVVVFRDPTLDPLASTHPELTTVRWFAHPLRRDPGEMVGQSTSGVGVHGGEQVLDPASWVLAGTGLHRADVLRQVVGDETDGYHPGVRTEPPGVDVVLVSAFRGGMGPELVSTTYYAAPSGAGVFSAGTTYWPCDLESSCPGPLVPRRTRDAVRRITATVLDAFSRPFAGRAHPSRDVLPPAAADLLGRLAPGAAVVVGPETEQVPTVDHAPRAPHAPGTTGGAKPTATPSGATTSKTVVAAGKAAGRTPGTRAAGSVVAAPPTTTSAKGTASLSTGSLSTGTTRPAARPTATSAPTSAPVAPVAAAATR
jgi:hypothetical protein